MLKPMLLTRLAAPAVLAALLLPAGVAAMPISLDSPNFVADPTVTISAGGNTASFVEDPAAFDVLLVNDPGVGDPLLFTPVAGSSLSLNYSFTEGLNDDDEFGVFLLDGNTGLSFGAPFEFFADSTASGLLNFDLSALVGEWVGVQFQLSSFDNSFDSTATVSDLQFIEPPPPPPPSVPLPGSLLLIAVGGVLLRRNRRDLQAKTQ